MNEQPNIGPSSELTDASSTRDPAQDAASGSQTHLIAPNALPDLSVADGNSSVGRNTAAEPPKLDGYDVITPIGEGGMGTVWRAVQLSTRRNVALKMISAGGFGSERARQRFDREVEITARLEHPNIARVYDSGINRGVYFYAMELIDGVPLDQYVSRHHLSRTDILKLFAIVCHAVDHAHQHGVIHRDLKPGNILVTPDGQPHVLDFGLAKALEQAGKEAGISIDGEIAGTPGYMSPEQAAGKLDIDARCDVYSLGVILYRLLTGQSPHDLSGTYLDILRRVSDEEPKRPRTADHTIDRELEALLLCALQRDPSHRYKTAGELAQDVENYLRGDPISAKPPTLAYFAGKRVRKHRVKIVIAAVVALLAGSAILLTVRLYRAHRDAKLLAQRDATQFAQKDAGDKAFAAARKSMSDGDAAGVKGDFSGAQSQYLTAIRQFNKAGIADTPAELALWNLARVAPPPLNVIPPLHAGPSGASLMVGALAILPDNIRALAGFDEGSLRLFDLPTGRVLQQIATGQGAIHSVAASTDSKLVLTGGDSGSLKVWNLNNGRLKTELRDPNAPLKNRVTRVAISPNGRYGLSVSGATPELLASGTYNDTVTLWDFVTGQVLLRSDRTTQIFDANQTITAAEFSPDSSMVVTAGAQVVVWSAGAGKQLATIPASATAANFSSDGRLVMAGSSDGKLHILNLANGQVSNYPGVPGQGAIQSVGFNPRQGKIVTISEMGEFLACDGNGEGAWRQPARGDVDCSALSPDGSLAVTANDAGLSIWRMSPSLENREIANDGPFPNASISGDARLILARSTRRKASSPGALLFDAATGNIINPPGFPGGACSGGAISRDGRTVAIATATGLSVWSLDPPHEIRRYKTDPPHAAGESVAVAVSDDGQKVAISVADHSMHIYCPARNSEQLKLVGHTEPMTSAVFSHDGHLLLTGSEDQTARLWDADTGTSITLLRGHEAPVNAVAISNDGKLAATAGGAALFQRGNDNSVRTWEIPSGKPISVFNNFSRANAVAFSGDGRLIAAGGDDQSVNLWDRSTGESLQQVHTLTPVLSLDFDQSGQFLVCGGNTLSLWDFHRAAEQRELDSALTAIRAKDVSVLSATDVGVLAHWYAFQDEAAYAIDLFHRAEASGSSEGAMERWRLDLKSGDVTAAERDRKLLSAQDAPPYYVNLCMQPMRK